MNLFERQSALNDLFRQGPVSAAYVTGSLAGRQSFGQLTDVDVAILLLEHIKADSFFDYQLYFFNELVKRLDTDALDVVILNQASLILKLQVIKYGQILYAREEKKRIAFETKAVMDYLDLKRFDDLQSAALMVRVQASSFSLSDATVREALEQAGRTTRQLASCAGLTSGDLDASPAQRAAMERWLVLAVTSCLRACAAIVAARNLKRPEGYQDLLSTVAGAGVISKPLSYRLEAVVEARNHLAECDTLSAAYVVEQAKHAAAVLGEFVDELRRLETGGAP